jgi:hypothetical protein
MNSFLEDGVYTTVIMKKRQRNGGQDHTVAGANSVVFDVCTVFYTLKSFSGVSA